MKVKKAPAPKCACHQDAPASARIEIRIGRVTTVPVVVCTSTRDRIRAIFDARDIIETAVDHDPWQPLRDKGMRELELRAAAGDR